ncbi:DoxX family protein [Legionella oakridgensis]|uniref:DoxX n=2 Tax=Legionella oakridgensis TaxID=29423 RepID=A0A0W0WXS1_9GAMM|nr:DoxX family protein [Legionella oakridgensis]AHE67560.1 putative membrane protein [Legionella oakridgensis ATCC 33761 = DSM 21215]ETO92806.1 putative membrane protein [Legionella oakridgensis RV-2-2007]KTD37088.1 DoxX [Legionella oakridgensis]STY20603.1 DoxX [Legionella longbeachae]
MVQKEMLMTWQHFLIRIYLGLNMLPHCSEKLFLGTSSYYQEVHDFMLMGIIDPKFMVILAGIIEFAIFFAFTFGFLTRIAAVGASIYLLMTTLLGHHFTNGFIWVSPGGGWEFPIMWGFLYLTFLLTGGGLFSLDSWLYKQSKLKIFR